MTHIRAPRPEGTSGFDHGYRMIIEDRYKRIALLRKWNGRLMLINAVLAFFMGLWCCVPLLAGASYPLMPAVVVFLELLGVLLYFFAAPGTGREKLNFLKGYGFVAGLAAAEHTLSRFWYHVKLPKESLNPKVLADYIHVHYEGMETGRLLSALQVWEALLDASLCILLLAATATCKAYIAEKRAPVPSAADGETSAEPRPGDKKNR